MCAYQYTITLKTKCMSHNKNVNAFERLAGLCTGYGGAYNPGHQNLQVEALITKLYNAQQAMNEVKKAETAFDVAMNHREMVIEDAKQLSSRVISVLKSTGVNEL